MAISATQIISLIIVLVVFGLLIFGLARTFRQTCPSEQEFSKQYNKCIDICEPNHIWNDAAGKCVINCKENEDFCVGVNQCYNKDTQQCIDKIICNKYDKICGSNCYNPEKELCSSEKKLFNISDICFKNPENNQNNIYYTDKMCSTNQYCDNSSYTCVSCSSEQIPCGDYCCTSEQECIKKKCLQKCPSENPIRCDDGTCCKIGNCLPDGTCCQGEILDDKTCCDITKVCGNICCTDKQKCDKTSNKCVISCDYGGVTCDPKTQTCFDDDINHRSSCKTNGCIWTTVDYTPVQMKDRNDKNFNICSAVNKSDNTNVLVFAKNTDRFTKMQRTDKSEQAEESKASCTDGNCYDRIGRESGIYDTQFVTKDGKTYCYGYFDCEQTTLLPAIGTFANQCPVDGNRCCYIDGQLTGQICEQGEICDNNQCIKGFTCDFNGNVIPADDGQFKTRQQAVCLPAKIIDTTDIHGWCSEMNGLSGDDCNPGGSWPASHYGPTYDSASKQCAWISDNKKGWIGSKKMMDSGVRGYDEYNLNPKYDWTCLQQAQGSNQRHVEDEGLPTADAYCGNYGNGGVGCVGNIPKKDCKLYYSDSIRKKFDPSHPCYCDNDCD
jgi:hypothetical protein